MPRGVYKRTPEILAALRASAAKRSTDTGWCQVAGCDQPSHPRRANVCEMHYARYHRTGQYTLAGPRPRIAEPSYRTAHARVQFVRGKASTHPCCDCGHPAAHWSFAWRRVPRERWLWSEANGLCPYTGDEADYDARCRHCACWYDKGYLPDGAWIPRQQSTTEGVTR